MTKDSGLRIRVQRELHDRFLEVCRARDKVAHMQRLRCGEQGKDYDVIACIAGRGFKVRREDMRRCFRQPTARYSTGHDAPVIEHTRIREYRVR